MKTSVESAVNHSKTARPGAMRLEIATRMAGLLAFGMAAVAHAAGGPRVLTSAT